MALGFCKYKFMVKFWQTPDKIPSLWHTSGKVIHKIKVCGNVLASFLKFDTFWQCYGNLPLVAKLFAITLPLAVKIGTVLWHRIPLPQSCCNLVATLRQRIFFIRVCHQINTLGLKTRQMSRKCEKHRATTASQFFTFSGHLPRFQA